MTGDDLQKISAWMAERIGQLSYKRTQEYLCREERTVLALFIRQLLWLVFVCEQSTFNAEAILKDITHRLGLKGYEHNRTLKLYCDTFARNFPDFVDEVTEAF